jgi:hypothetical protein
MYVYNPLRVKYFHEALAGNAHEGSLKPRIGKASSYFCVAHESIPWLFYFSSFEKRRRRPEQSLVVVLKVLTDFKNFMMLKHFYNQIVKWVMVCFYRMRGVLLRDGWCAFTG